MSRRAALAGKRVIARDAREGRGESLTRRQLLSPTQNAFPTLVREDEKGSLRLCDGCGTEFQPRRRHQKFCTASCRKQHWERRHRPGLHAFQVNPPLLREYLKAHGAAICGFCQRLNPVDVERGGEQRAVCRCGAQWFRRRRGGQLERGWKKGSRQILYS